MGNMGWGVCVEMEGGRRVGGRDGSLTGAGHPSSGGGTSLRGGATGRCHGAAPRGGAKEQCHWRARASSSSGATRSRQLMSGSYTKASSMAMTLYMLWRSTPIVDSHVERKLPSMPRSPPWR